MIPLEFYLGIKDRDAKNIGGLFWGFIALLR